MNKLSDLLLERLASKFKRQSITTASKWALTYRHMGQPFPGPWSFKYHPWLREMHDSEAELNVGQKAAQMGFTETAINIVFYYMDVHSVDCLYVLPSKNPDASNFSYGRFDPAIDYSPHLAKMFSDIRNVGLKRAGNTNLYIVGSKSRSTLKSYPVGVIIFDEKDEMDQDNIPLAVERQSGYSIRRTWEISTPTVDDYGINKTYKNSTCEEFVFPCPACSHHITLRFPESLVVVGEHENDPRVNESHLICTHCKATLPSDIESKARYLAPGYWHATNKSLYRGFHVSQLYSCAPNSNPVETAKSYHRAQRSPADAQEFYNSKLGLPYVAEGARVTDSDINACIGNYSTGPKDGLITMGIDVGSWLHYEIGQWISADEYLVLAAGKVTHFEELYDLFTNYSVYQAVIDMQPERRKAIEFAQKFNVKLCYYSRGIQGKNIHVGKDEEFTLTVDRTSWLDLALGRFKRRKITLPYDISFEYRTHMKNLVRIYEKDPDGNPVGRYIHNGQDHFGHARAYSEIAGALALGAGVNQEIDNPW